MELSASDANVSTLSRDSRQPIIAKPPAGGNVYKHVRWNGTCIQVEVSDIIWLFDIVRRFRKIDLYYGHCDRMHLNQNGFKYLLYYQMNCFKVSNPLLKARNYTRCLTLKVCMCTYRYVIPKSNRFTWRVWKPRRLQLASEKILTFASLAESSNSIFSPCAEGQQRTYKENWDKVVGHKMTFKEGLLARLCES